MNFRERLDRLDRRLVGMPKRPPSRADELHLDKMLITCDLESDALLDSLNVADPRPFYRKAGEVVAARAGLPAEDGERFGERMLAAVADGRPSTVYRAIRASVVGQAAAEASWFKTLRELKAFVADRPPGGDGDEGSADPPDPKLLPKEPFHA